MHTRIEFMGIPGSGKSTLTKKIYGALKDRNIGLYQDIFNSSIKSFVKKKNLGPLRYCRFLFIKLLQSGNYHSTSLYGDALSKYLLNQLPMINELVQTIYQDIPVGRRKYVLKYLLNDLYRWETIQRYSQAPKYIIMDEGFSHRLLNIYMFSDFEKKAKELNNFFSFIEFPEIIIYVKCSVNTSLERMQRRKRGTPLGLRDFNEKELYNYLASMERYGERFLDYFAEKNVKIIQVENNDLNMTAEQVSRQLMDIID